MNLKIITIAVTILFTSNLKAQGSKNNSDSSSFSYNVIVDPSISFGPMAFGLIEGSLGAEWYKPQTPQKRWNLKASYGQGNIWLIPIQDSGDWNGTSAVYSLEANYIKDFFRWAGRHFDKSTGYIPHSLFYELGVLGGFGDQDITTLHTWSADLPLDEKRYGLFTGLRAGLGYRYNFQDEIIVNFIPVSVAAGYIHISSPWEHGWPRSGFEVLSLHLLDVQLLFPLN